MYLEGDLQVVMLVVVISMFLHTYSGLIKKNRIYNSQPATNFDDTQSAMGHRECVLVYVKEYFQPITDLSTYIHLNPNISSLPGKSYGSPQHTLCLKIVLIM
jgi:hypothetical protein